MSSLRAELGEKGVVRIEGAARVIATEAGRHLTTDFGAGRRTLPQAVLDVVSRGELSPLVSLLLDAPARLVRVLLFDKSASANWGVPWHQDRSIAVTAHAEARGFDHWTQRDGYWQVEPPVAVLERMVTLRVHLDDCGPEMGPLLVLPATHGRGRLEQSAVRRLADERQPEVCVARVGDVLAMKPLLIHSSRSATQPARRRVLHLEYAAADLPLALSWALAA